MVVVDADHPDIEAYVDWKVKEEQKVASLVTGSKINAKHLKAVMKACLNCEGDGDDCFDPEKNPALKREIKFARRAQVSDNMIKRVIQFAKQGYKDIDFPIYDADWDSEAYLTVSGQNSNNSVRVTDDFLRSVEAGGKWDLTWRKNGEVAKTVEARELWEKIGEAAWACADPGIQFHTTVNDWHTCVVVRRDPRLEPVLGIHVPRRHGVQSRVAEFADVPRRHDQAIQRRVLRARRPALDHRARNLGDDGELPLEEHRRAPLPLPHARPRLRQPRRAPDVVGHSL